jgi:hypothetical protein
MGPVNQRQVIREVGSRGLGGVELFRKTEDGGRRFRFLVGFSGREVRFSWKIGICVWYGDCICNRCSRSSR